MKYKYIIDANDVYSKEVKCQPVDLIVRIKPMIYRNNENYRNVKIRYSDDGKSGIITFNKKGYVRGSYFRIYDLTDFDKEMLEEGLKICLSYYKQ